MYQVTKIFIFKKNRVVDTINVNQWVNDIEYFRIDLQYLFRAIYKNDNMNVSFEHKVQSGDVEQYPKNEL
jgi:hypothetical protein